VEFFFNSEKSQDIDEEPRVKELVSLKNEKNPSVFIHPCKVISAEDYQLSKVGYWVLVLRPELIQNEFRTLENCITYLFTPGS